MPAGGAGGGGGGGAGAGVAAGAGVEIGVGVGSVNTGKPASAVRVTGTLATSGMITLLSLFTLSGTFCKFTRPTVVPGAGTFQITTPSAAPAASARPADDR